MLREAEIIIRLTALICATRLATFIVGLVAPGLLFSAPLARVDRQVFECPEVVFFKTSDSHSHYGVLDAQPVLPNLIRTIGHRVREIRRRCHTTEFVLLFTGDIAGTSLDAELDWGDLSYEMMSLWSHLYEVIPTAGNHEGFDYVDSPIEEGLPGNGIFYLQNRYFLDGAERTGAPGHPNRILLANAHLTEMGEEFFTPYRDIYLPSGKTLRVVGMIYETFFLKSSYSRTSDLQFFTDFDPLFKTAKEQILQADHDGVDQIIFEVHDDYSKVEELARAIMGWRERPRVKILFFGAGHDHLVEVGNVAGVPVIDAGDDYQMTEIHTNAFGDVTKIEHRPWSFQARYRPADDVLLTPLERRMIAMAEAEIARVEAHDGNSDVLGVTAGTWETKFSLKEGPRPLGRAIANSLKKWAEDFIEERALAKHEVVALQDSTSYRWTSPIPAGPLRRGHIKRMFPFNNSVGLFLMTGHQINEVYRIFNEAMAYRNYTPQMSSNLRRAHRGYGANELEVLGADGEWRLLKSDRLYWFAADDFLGGNRMGMPEIQEIFDKAIRSLETTPTTQEVHLEYLAPEIERICEQVLGGDR